MKKKYNWKDIGNRAIKTFIQAFIASVGANLTVLSEAIGNDNLKGVIISIGIGAVAAGVSAVWNIVISPMVQLEDTNEPQ